MANQVLSIPTELKIGTNFDYRTTEHNFNIGTNNTIGGINKFVFGDTNNFTCYGYAFVVGESNTASGANWGQYDFILGTQNTVHSDGNVGNINSAFGNQNYCTGDCSIVWGKQNTLYGLRSAVGGQSNIMTVNTTMCEGSFIFGKSCFMSDSQQSAIFGYQNTIGRWNDFDFVAGQGNTITDTSGAHYNAIFGQKNTVNGGDRNLVAGGDATTGHNVTGSDNLVVGGGASGGNTVSGSNNIVFSAASNVSGNANIAGGFAHTVTAQQSLVLGDQMNVSGNRNLVIGRLGVVQGNNNFSVGESSGTGSGVEYSMAFGAQASVSNGVTYASAFGATVIARNTGQHAIATGRFTYNGDAQSSVLTLRQLTTDDNFTEMSIDNGSTYLALENGKAYAFVATIVGLTVSTGANRAMYHLKWHTFRGANAGTTTVDGLVQEVIYESDAGLDATVTADTTNGRPAIKVKGLASTNIRWVARVEMTEVGYS